MTCLNTLNQVLNLIHSRPTSRVSLYIIAEHSLQLLAALLNCVPTRKEKVESTHTNCLILEILNIYELLMLSM